MPFRSEKQKRFLFAKHPEIAKRWANEYGGDIQPSPKAAALKQLRTPRKKR